MKFCNEKVFVAVSNYEFQKSILSIAKKVQEVDFKKKSFMDDLCELRLEEDLSLKEKVEFEAVLKNDLESFLIGDQLFKKYKNEFNFLKKHTLKLAIGFERNKTESFLKDIMKNEALISRITVLSKSYIYKKKKKKTRKETFFLFNFREVI